MDRRKFLSFLGRGAASTALSGVAVATGGSLLVKGFNLESSTCGHQDPGKTSCSSHFNAQYNVEKVLGGALVGGAIGHAAGKAQNTAPTMLTLFGVGVGGFLMHVTHPMQISAHLDAAKNDSSKHTAPQPELGHS